MSADLHCHTKMSDGSVTIEELVILAKNKGITTISVTDHDTFAGSTRAKVFAKRHGVTVIPGIEISAFDYDRNQKSACLMLSLQLSGPFGRSLQKRLVTAERKLQVLWYRK